MKSTNARKPIVYAYGFDKLGYPRAAENNDEGKFVLRFIPYSSPDFLEPADGIVIPSGIFETFKTRLGAYGHPQTVCISDSHLLADREKQVFNACKAGAWICFLLSELDNVNPHTDLAKKVANQMFKIVRGHDPQPHIHCKADEFREFFNTYGIARTSLHFPRDDANTRILATSIDENATFAAECAATFFLLPFKSLQNLDADLVPLLRSAISSILVYKQRNELYLPDWVEQIQFQTEKRLNAKITELKARLEALKHESSVWRTYKGILSGSGRTLNQVVVNVLRQFFGLNLQSQEKYIEDAIIYNHNNEPAFVVEIKGVKGGIKRDNINQVDSHRERLELSHEIPGLLIINDFSEVAGLEQRRLKQIDRNHIELALRQNVRILRTTALLDLMLATEESNNRADTFITICTAGAPLVVVSTV